MKIYLLFFIVGFSLNLQAATNIELTVKAGDSVKNFKLDSVTTKKDQFDFFYKKAKRLQTHKSQDKNLCLRNYLELTLKEENTVSRRLGCLNSKEKIATSLKEFANLLNLQYGK